MNKAQAPDNPGLSACEEFSTQHVGAHNNTTGSLYINQFQLRPVTIYFSLLISFILFQSLISDSTAFELLDIYSPTSLF